MVMIGAQIAFAVSIGVGGMIGLKPAVAYASGDQSMPEWVSTPMCDTTEHTAIVLPCNWIDDNGVLVHFTNVPCVYEDGNVDGLPCIWTSPRTGEAYLVTSEEYRD
jgi:hypothetical protein